MLFVTLNLVELYAINLLKHKLSITIKMYDLVERNLPAQSKTGLKRNNGDPVPGPFLQILLYLVW